MRKILVMALCFMLSLSLAGCGKTELKIGKESSVAEGTSSDVSMGIVEGTVTPTKAKVLITNNTDIEIYSGNEHSFAIEVLENGKWYTIDTKDWVNTAEAYIFEDARELDIGWSNIYGALPNGHYRIVKYFFPWKEDGTYGIQDGFYLTAEFDIE